MGIQLQNETKKCSFKQIWFRPFLTLCDFPDYNWGGVLLLAQKKIWASYAEEIGKLSQPKL